MTILATTKETCILAGKIRVNQNKGRLPAHVDL